MGNAHPKGYGSKRIYEICACHRCWYSLLLWCIAVNPAEGENRKKSSLQPCDANRHDFSVMAYCLFGLSAQAPSICTGMTTQQREKGSTERVNSAVKSGEAIPQLMMMGSRGLATHSGSKGLYIGLFCWCGSTDHRIFAPLRAWFSEIVTTKVMTTHTHILQKWPIYQAQSRPTSKLFTLLVPASLLVYWLGTINGHW